MSERNVVERITAYLIMGGLFNPELADHDAVRDLLIDARDALYEERSRRGRLAEVARTMRARGDALVEGAGDDEEDAWMGTLGEHYQLLAGEIEEALAGRTVPSHCKEIERKP